MDKLLIQFIEVGQLKNVSHAANKLGISQPTLTLNMKKLEQRYGVELFIRHANGVSLTEYGLFLLEQSQKMYDIYCNTLNQIQFFKQQKAKSIAVGTGHVWWELFLKDVFSYYQNNQSDINLTFEVGNHLRLMDLLLNNEIDFFIGHEIKGLSEQKGLKFIPLFSCEDTFYASANHELISKIVNEEDIKQYPILELTPVENRYRHLIEEKHPNRKKSDELAWQNQAKLTTNSLVTALDMLSLSNAIMRNYPINMTQYFSKFNVMPLKNPLI